MCRLAWCVHFSVPTQEQQHARRSLRRRWLRRRWRRRWRRRQEQRRAVGGGHPQQQHVRRSVRRRRRRRTVGAETKKGRLKPKRPSKTKNARKDRKG